MSWVTAARPLSTISPRSDQRSPRATPRTTRLQPNRPMGSASAWSPSSARPARARSTQTCQSPESQADTARRTPRRPASSRAPCWVTAASAAARASRNPVRSTSRRHQANRTNEAASAPATCGGIRPMVRSIAATRPLSKRLIEVAVSRRSASAGCPASSQCPRAATPSSMLSNHWAARACCVRSCSGERRSSSASSISRTRPCTSYHPPGSKLVTNRPRASASSSRSPASDRPVRASASP